MNKKLEKINSRTLFGIELNIEVLILVLLWHFGYTTIFWILLFASIIGSISKSKQIEKA